MLPEMRLTPRDRTCTARATFDAAAAVLSVEFVVGGADPPPGLVGRIEAAVGIREPSLRLVLGEVDVAFRPPGRIDSIEVRTSPSKWRSERLALPNGEGAVWFDPAVEYDENGLSVIEVEASVCWDAQVRVWALRFAEGAVRWFALAEVAAMGLDREDRLCELRFVLAHTRSE